MKGLGLILLFATLASQIASAAAPITVNIKWDYKDFNSVVEIYEVKDRPRLWETKSVKSLKQTPVTSKIEGAHFSLEPGKTKRFALLVENKTDRPLFFFAAPHVVYPVEHALGFKFKCLCINHAFKVGPRESWYRIVEFRLSNDFVGKELTITHSVIGIDEKRADSFSKEPVQPDM